MTTFVDNLSIRKLVFICIEHWLLWYLFDNDDDDDDGDDEHDEDVVGDHLQVALLGLHQVGLVIRSPFKDCRCGKALK